MMCMRWMTVIFLHKMQERKKELRKLYVTID